MQTDSSVCHSFSVEAHFFFKRCKLKLILAFQPLYMEIDYSQRVSLVLFYLEYLYIKNY